MDAFMKLHWSPRSPFARKVMIVAYELGLAARIARVRTQVAMTAPNAALMTENPLSKLPVLVLDDGTVIYDSPVICDYLDGLGGSKLIPQEPSARLTALRRQALGDGFLDFLLLWRYERDRPPPQRSQIQLDSYAARRAATLKSLDGEAADLAATPMTIGHIALACALSYLDFRYAGDDWRTPHPKLADWHAEIAERPSMRATEPVDD
jgi:glutathione S-transferase